jgi:AraC-like DNA-binding protein
MDKINLGSWNEIFGKTEQRVVFSSDRYTDIHFRFEEPGLLAGYVQSMSTAGMQLTEFFLQAGQPFQLVEEDVKESAESVFVLGGAAESHFYNRPSSLCFKKNHHNFQYNRQFGGEHTIGSSGFHALTITYDIGFLNQLLHNEHSPVMGQLANCMYTQKSFVAASEALPFQSRISEVVGSMQQCPFTGVTRYLFLESKMLELFVLQLQQVQAMAGKKNEGITAADKEKLFAVKNYIENAYLETFCLKDLTYRFGLNEFKLKKGYKQLFQTTVFGHVLQLRMQKARTLLQAKAMNVSEAAFFIGYENVSSFCTEFKKQFGCSPGKMMN